MIVNSEWSLDQQKKAFNVLHSYPLYFTVTIKNLGFFENTELLASPHTQINMTKPSLNTMTGLFVPGRYNTGSREQHWNALKRPCMATWNCVMIISYTYLILNKRIRFERVTSASGSATIMAVLLKMYVCYKGHLQVEIRHAVYTKSGRKLQVSTFQHCRI